MFEEKEKGSKGGKKRKVLQARLQVRKGEIGTTGTPSTAPLHALSGLLGSEGADSLVEEWMYSMLELA